MCPKRRYHSIKLLLHEHGACGQPGLHADVRLQLWHGGSHQSIGSRLQHVWLQLADECLEPAEQHLLIERLGDPYRHLFAL